jgi:hypothetical protein
MFDLETLKPRFRSEFYRREWEKKQLDPNYPYDGFGTTPLQKPMHRR